MPIEGKKIKEAFRLGWLISLGVSIVVLVSLEPLRVAFFPAIEKFVKAYIEILLNLLYFVFFICSLSLIILAALVHREYRRMKMVEAYYKSQQVVDNYYKKSKVYDFTKAIATAISKYSRRDLGPVDSGEEVIVDGTHQIFYPNGQLEKEFTYKNGRLSGQWRSYYADGVLHQEKCYKDGKLHGVFRAYDDQGVLFFETSYKEGQKHGTEKSFFANGSIQYLDTFHEGRMVNRKTYNEGGELQFDYDYHEE